MRWSTTLWNTRGEDLTTSKLSNIVQTKFNAVTDRKAGKVPGAWLPESRSRPMWKRKTPYRDKCASRLLLVSMQFFAFTSRERLLRTSWLEHYFSTLLYSLWQRCMCLKGLRLSNMKRQRVVDRSPTSLCAACKTHTGRARSLLFRSNCLVCSLYSMNACLACFPLSYSHELISRNEIKSWSELAKRLVLRVELCPRVQGWDHPEFLPRR